MNLTRDQATTLVGRALWLSTLLLLSGALVSVQMHYEPSVRSMQAQSERYFRETEANRRNIGRASLLDKVRRRALTDLRDSGAVLIFRINRPAD